MYNTFGGVEILSTRNPSPSPLGGAVIEGLMS